jgi:hypothetical protein
MKQREEHAAHCLSVSEAFNRDRVVLVEAGNGTASLSPT